MLDPALVSGIRGQPLLRDMLRGSDNWSAVTDFCSRANMPVTARPLLHSTLLAARPGETVTAIASAHGYLNLGTLAARYHRHYGETPAATQRNCPLRRSP